MKEKKTGGYLPFFRSIFLPLANTTKCLNKHEQSVYFQCGGLSRKRYVVTGLSLGWSLQKVNKDLR